MSGWGSSQESLLSQLTMMGYPSAHSRVAILSNMKADLFGLLDWMEKNPPPSSTTTTSPKPSTGPDDDIKRIAKAEEDSKKEKISQLKEMGFTLVQATYVTNKFPNYALSRLLDWLDNPTNLREIQSGSSGSSGQDDAWVIVDKNKKKPKDTVLKVGLKVRVLKSVRDPLHGWGSVTPDAIGTVRRMEGAQDIWVDFPKQQNWHGVRDEMEIIDEPDEEPGVEPGVIAKSPPTTGTGPGTSPPITRIVSPEPAPEIMRIDPDEGKAEKPIRVGSKVKVKESVKNPTNGWGAVSHGIVGVVSRIDGESAYVDFQLQKDWKAEVAELECMDEEEKKASAPPVETPDDVDALSSPDFQRGDSEMNDMLRSIFETDKKAGRPLSLDQINFILLKDHKTGTKYSCQVCYDDEVELDKLLVLDECRHYLCRICMSKHIVTQIKNTNVSHIRCPEPDCKLMLGYNEVKRCVTDTEFALYERILLEDGLKKDPSCRWCPKIGCGTAMLGTPNPKNPMLRCPKEDCKFAFCFNCKEAWHSDSTCEQYQAWKMENSEADKRFAAWAAKNTKACPGCRAPIQKNAGCNHMKCSSCKHEFCWLCMKSVLGDGGKYKPGHWALDESSPCYQKMHT